MYLIILRLFLPPNSINYLLYLFNNSNTGVRNYSFKKEIDKFSILNNRYTLMLLNPISTRARRCVTTDFDTAL